MSENIENTENAEVTNETEKSVSTFDLTLTLQQVNTILSCLNEVAFKIADPIIRNIVEQAKQQLPELNHSK